MFRLAVVEAVVRAFTLGFTRVGLTAKLAWLPFLVALPATVVTAVVVFAITGGVGGSDAPGLQRVTLLFAFLLTWTIFVRPIFSPFSAKMTQLGAFGHVENAPFFNLRFGLSELGDWLSAIIRFFCLIAPVIALALAAYVTLGPACADAIAQDPSLISDPAELRALAPNSALTPLSILILYTVLIMFGLSLRFSVLTPFSALERKVAFVSAWRASCGHAWAIFMANIFWLIVGLVMFLVGLAVAACAFAILSFVGGLAGGVVQTVLTIVGGVIVALYVIYALLVALGARATFGGSLAWALHDAGRCEDCGGEAASS